MDQISRLIFDVQGRDRGGSKVLNDAAAASDKAHAGFSRLTGTLSGLGGPFDQITQLASNLGDAIDGNLSKIQKYGLGITATGAALTAFAAGDQQAQRQLQQAIDNTGASYADYRTAIEETVHQQENYANSAKDTQNALTTLVTATQDTSQALSEMGFVADIAAAKHESLAEAATQLVQAQAGNTRAFKSFGIVLDGVGTQTEQIDRALRQLQDRLSGQASASVDTFAGRLKIAGTRIEDQLAALGKYGPQITAAGAATTAFATVEQLLIARRLASAGAATAEAAATERLVAAKAQDAAASNIDAAAESRLAISRGAGGIGMVGRLAKGGAIAGLGYYGATTVGNAVGGNSGRFISDVGGGAAIGAGIGSIFPGVGTAVGAGVGAVVGAVSFGVHSSSGPDPAQLAAAAQTEKGYAQLQQRLALFQRVARSSSGLVHDLAVKQVEAAKTALNAGEATHAYATALTKEQQAATDATLSLQGQLKALEDATGKALNLSSAQDDLQLAMHNMAQAAHDGGKALDGHSLAAEANRNAIRDAVTKMLALIQAQKDAGVSAGKVRASAIAMARALERNAGQIYGNKTAVDDLLRSLGVLPKQIATSLGSLKGLATDLNNFFGSLAGAAYGWGLEAGSSFDAGFSGGLNGGAQTPDLAQGAKLAMSSAQSNTSPSTDAAKSYGKHLAKTVVDSYAPAVNSGVDAATKKAMDAAQQRLAREKQLMQATLQQVTGAYQSTKQALIDQANLGNRQQGTDLLGATGPAESIVASKRQFARQMIRFAHLIRRLEDEYSPVIVDEVEQLGAEAGIPAAVELLHYSRKQHRAVNRAERRIERAAGRISSTVTSQDYSAQILKVLQKLPADLGRELLRDLRHLHLVVNSDQQDRHAGQKVHAS